MDNPPSVPRNTFPSTTASAPFPPPPKALAPQGGITPVKFPSRPPVMGLKPLVLPRRVSPLQRAQEASQATSAARKSIDAILQSRPPWSGEANALSASQVTELEKNLRMLETKVGEQEMALADTQNKLADCERALAEAEALLAARDKVIAAIRRDSQTVPPIPGFVPANSEEMSALQKLKEELDRQEASLKEQRAAIRERELFLDESEASLFEKMQAHQEMETELEQKSEDVKRAMLRAGLIKPEPLPPKEKA